MSNSGIQAINTDVGKQVAMELLRLFENQIKARQPIPSYSVDIGTKGRWSK